MINKYIFIIVFSFVVLAAAAYALYPQPEAQSGLDEFAKCLAEKQITMYGADWCPHCQNEKSAFGDSFRFVPYVECPKDPQMCLAKRINGYPTWIFPDDKRLEGEQGIENLSRESGCKLPIIKK